MVVNVWLFGSRGSKEGVWRMEAQLETDKIRGRTPIERSALSQVSTTTMPTSIIIPIKGVIVEANLFDIVLPVKIKSRFILDGAVVGLSSTFSLEASS